MAVSRLILRLAILPVLVLLGAAQPAPLSPQVIAAAQVAIPSDCDDKRINQAIERKFIPDFRHCPIAIAEAVAKRFDGRLTLQRKDAPDDRAAPGIVFKQDPPGGSPLQKDPVTIYVSTGPPPAPQPDPAPPETPKPLPVGPIKIPPAAAVAGKPLHFKVSLQPAGVGGKVSYAVRRGSAQPGIDYTPVHGDLQLEPDAAPLPIDVETSPNVEAPAELTVLLVVMDGDRALARAVGTITQPPLAAPCPNGAAPPCPAGTESGLPPPLCADGTPEPCEQSPPDLWHEIVDWIIDLAPMIATGLAVGLGGALVDALRQPPSDQPPDPPEVESSTAADAAVSFAAKPGIPAPPTLGTAGAGLKGPIISLALSSVRGAARPIAQPPPTEDEHG